MHHESCYHTAGKYIAWVATRVNRACPPTAMEATSRVYGFAPSRFEPFKGGGDDAFVYIGDGICAGEFGQ